MFQVKAFKTVDGIKDQSLTAEVDQSKQQTHEEFNFNEGELERVQAMADEVKLMNF